MTHRFSLHDSASHWDCRLLVTLKKGILNSMDEILRKGSEDQGLNGPGAMCI